MILVHICCAPCAVIFPNLIKEYYPKYSNEEIVFYFFNPNIEPKKEHDKRLEEVKKLAKKYKLRLIVDEDYKENNQTWHELTKGLEKEPEGARRCDLCLAYRLAKTAEKADEINAGLFSMALTLSPYKNTELINNKAKEFEKAYNLKFLDFEFFDQITRRKLYYEMKKLSSDYNLYYQKYCGCFSSERNKLNDKKK